MKYAELKDKHTLLLPLSVLMPLFDIKAVRVSLMTGTGEREREGH